MALVHHACHKNWHQKYSIQLVDGQEKSKKNAKNLKITHDRNQYNNFYKIFL